MTGSGNLGRGTGTNIKVWPRRSMDRPDLSSPGLSGSRSCGERPVREVR
jgi:hypothetical protein